MIVVGGVVLVGGRVTVSGGVIVVGGVVLARRIPSGVGSVPTFGTAGGGAVAVSVVTTGHYGKIATRFFVVRAITVSSVSLNVISLSIGTRL